MELHRLDGFTTSGLDSLAIQDVDYELVEDTLYAIDSLDGLAAIGASDPVEITHEILDENGNVVMYADAQENLYQINGLEGFFKKIGKGFKKIGKFVKKAVIKPIGKAAKFVGKKVLKPAFKFVNRFLNPVTILLRNGFLLAMKTNMFKVAERLRFGYLSDSIARKRGINMGGLARVRRIMRKAEKIYEGAGGKKRNLRKAILSGKGNRNRAVPLNGYDLGSITAEYTDAFERFVVEADADVVSQFISANDGIAIEGLGEVATGTAMAAASGAVAGIAALLKNVTGVFKSANNIKNQATTLISNPFKPPVLPSSSPKATLVKTSQFVPDSPLAIQRANTPFGPSIITTPVKESFLTKYKTPLIIAGVVAVGGALVYATRSGRSAPSRNGVSGVPKKRVPKRKRDALGRYAGKKTTQKMPKKLRAKRIL